MGRTASWGWSKGFDGREVARQAAQQAINHMGATRPVIGLVFISQEFDMGAVGNGLANVLGTTPLWGVSTSHPITSAGEQTRAVVIGLFTGSDINAKVSFWPGFAQNSEETASQLIQSLYAESRSLKGLLLAADGINGDVTRVCAALTDFSSPVAGCMASGDILHGKTYQMAGNQFGTGGLACATLEGALTIGMGIGHGWSDMGIYFEISKARDIWIQQLGQVTAAEAYSRFLGYPAREWAFPPLKELVRLYPLGIELTPGNSELIIRSPIQVEVDGSLRMNIPVAEGQVARLLVGDRNNCLEAAHQAARTAIKSLMGAKPLMAVILVDQAWQYLFQSDSNKLIAAIKAEVGEIPLIGAYTLGQISRQRLEGYVRVYNQNLLVAVFGER
ncbi:MAG TPA: FIST N-terminal domain-containing protein [Anaerolineaceae bacterium]|nr:FIST N-terminal domain-containing protein [Anaerolineaceae bacterium]